MKHFFPIFAIRLTLCIVLCLSASSIAEKLSSGKHQFPERRSLYSQAIKARKGNQRIRRSEKSAVPVAFTVYNGNRGFTKEPNFNSILYGSQSFRKDGDQSFKTNELNQAGTYFFALEVPTNGKRGAAWRLQKNGGNGSEGRVVQDGWHDSFHLSTHTGTALWDVSGGGVEVEYMNGDAWCSATQPCVFTGFKIPGSETVGFSYYNDSAGSVKGIPKFTKAFKNNGDFIQDTAEFKVTKKAGLYFFVVELPTYGEREAAWRLRLTDGNEATVSERIIKDGWNGAFHLSTVTATVVWKVNTGQSVKLEYVKGEAWCSPDMPCVFTGFQVAGHAAVKMIGGWR